MRINQIKINSYGKLKDKEINFLKGINLIEGNNESGKSTIMKFMLNCLYGTSKNKKGKDVSDYEKYKPWSESDFSGKIWYELDSGKRYEIYRDFNKKNPRIFDENADEISNNYSIDKNKGNQFFYEQTKIDEELFLFTAAMLQQDIEVEKSVQNSIIQKMYNIVGTGEDNVSYKRAIDRINRRQLDEVGTERSREKPINVIERRMEELRIEADRLKENENIKYEIENEKNQNLEALKDEEVVNDILQKVKNLKDNEEIEKEKIKLQEKIKNDNLERINLLKNEKNKIENEEKNKINLFNDNKIKIENDKKDTNKKYIILLVVIIFANILQWIFIKNIAINILVSLTAPMILTLYIIKLCKLNQKIKMNILNTEQEKNRKNEIENEINILEKNSNDINNELEKKYNNLNLKNNLEKEKIKNNYLNKIEKEKINNLFNLINSENINYLLNNSQNKINNYKIKLHTLNLDKKNIENELENLIKIEEELSQLEEKYGNLKQLDLSMNLVKDVLQESYEKMRNAITPKFTEKLSATISMVTNGKYNHIKYNDELGLIAENDVGDYVLIDRLSVGTIDQLYMSLRLSIIKDLTEEKIPIFLDETFAYFDDERLKNILNFLNKDFNEYQIIIFTCTKREEKILNELNIEYNLIKI